MARMRQLLLTLASGSAFYSGLVPALGLGEISLHSALNQPLDADIELLQIGDLGADEIKVRLASAEDFNRSGVERFYFLNDLRFTPLLQGGRGLIRVTSGKPVREPYLNFIVEVVRPGGQLLREYTVLIDPPGSSAYSPRTSLAPAQPFAAPPQPAARPLPEATRGERYRVQRGDSLWRIAGRLQAAGSEVSREALMADIHALNPQAFGGGDPNRLNAGVELLLPDSVLAAAPAETVGTEPETVAQANADASAVAQLEAQQTQVDTALAEANAQNSELQSALGDLQSQLAQLQAQMAEKDRQLQQIREDMQRRTLDNAAAATGKTPQQSAAAPVPAPAQSRWGLWLLGGVLVLTLLVCAVLLWRRRVVPREAEVLKGAAPAPEPKSEVRIISRPQAVAEPAPQFEPELDPEREAEVAAAAAQPPKRQPAGAADPLEEANIYIAYGRFADAANVLRKALGQHPERVDLRMRLYEVCGELGDAAAFFELERELREMGASHVQLDQVRARHAGMQRPRQDDALADAVLQLDEPEPEPPLQEDSQLNLDDLSLDADWDLANAFQPEQPARIKRAQEEEIEPSFSSDLEQLPDVQEVDADKEMLESFADLPREEVLEEEFVDAFSHEVVVRTAPQLQSEPVPASPLDSDLEHLAGSREHLVKLNTALAYIEQGDIGSACDILNEVISEGDEQQRERARELLAKIA